MLLVNKRGSKAEKKQQEIPALISSLSSSSRSLFRLIYSSFTHPPTKTHTQSISFFISPSYSFPAMSPSPTRPPLPRRHILLRFPFFRLSSRRLSDRFLLGVPVYQPKVKTAAAAAAVKVSSDSRDGASRRHKHLIALFLRQTKASREARDSRKQREVEGVSARGARRVSMTSSASLS